MIGLVKRDIAFFLAAYSRLRIFKVRITTLDLRADDSALLQRSVDIQLVLFEQLIRSRRELLGLLTNGPNG